VLKFHGLRLRAEPVLQAKVVAISIKSSVAAVACLLSAATFADEPMRCGNSIVSSLSSIAELLAKCGEPDAKDTRTGDVRSPRSSGNRTVKTGTTVIETWTYRGGRMAPRVIASVDGKIKNIATKH
jgi:hypothetical protein